MSKSIEEQLKELREQVRKHDILYDQNKPIITDTEYDELYDKLVKLEAEYPQYEDKNSPIHNVITSLVPKLKKVKHTNKILSLSKNKDFIGLDKFLKSLTKSEYILLQEKLDGLTLILKYEDGNLIQAVTRGNGDIGEDVTHTALKITNVPLYLKEPLTLEVRCEVIINISDFNAFNISGEYSNTRNLASGTIRQLDNSVVASRNLRAVAMSVSGLLTDTESEVLEFLTNNDFEVVKTYKFANTSEGIKELKELITNYEKSIREGLDYIIDGMVIKADSMKVRNELGETSKFPHWATAYKFKSLDAITTLTNVVWQLGKSGQLTPVGEFEMVSIDNVDITKATLHNYSNIENKDIRINDKILVERANDVIPQIMKSFAEERDGSEIVIEYPKKCPCCDSLTVRNGENIYCVNPECKPVVQAKVAHFVSKNALNVDSLGESIVEFLFENNIINSIPDLYKMKKEDLQGFKGFGDKKIDKILKNLDGSKSMPLDKIIYGLSINLIGQSVSKEISKIYPNMNAILEDLGAGVLPKKLLNIESFGEKMVSSLLDYLQDQNNYKLIQELYDLGFKMESEYFNKDNSESALNGLTIVLTGSLSKDRTTFKKELENLGAKVSGSVSKKTSMLIIGEDVEGNSKYLKAQELNVPIYTESEFNSKFMGGV